MFFNFESPEAGLRVLALATRLCGTRRAEHRQGRVDDRLGTPSMGFMYGLGFKV